MKNLLRIWIFLMCTALPILLSGSHAQETDDYTGLLMTSGWEQVRANCIRCHSAQLITQNSGSREVWKSRIVWMQETQGLSQLNPDVESEILDYLATNYGPKAASRRAPLAANLLPENPYTP